jgi:hypothetical protein
MSNDTQNKLTPEEEKMIKGINEVFRKDRERQIIEKAVKEKIAASNFSAQAGFIHTAAGRIITIGGLAAAAILAFFFINYHSPQPESTQNDVSFLSADSEVITQWNKSDSSTSTKKEKPKVKTKRKRRVRRDKEAVPGLPMASNNNSMAKAEQNIQEFSFSESYKFDKKANIHRFGRDLKKELEKLGMKFRNRANRNDVLYLVSEKKAGVSEENHPVKFYIVAKVNKRFPGNLNMSLRYYPLDSEPVPGKSKTINTIFYNNLKARVSGLINWKYKPEQNQE